MAKKRGSRAASASAVSALIAASRRAAGDRGLWRAASFPAHTARPRHWRSCEPTSDCQRRACDVSENMEWGRGRGGATGRAPRLLRRLLTRPGHGLNPFIFALRKQQNRCYKGGRRTWRRGRGNGAASTHQTRSPVLYTTDMMSARKPARHCAAPRLDSCVKQFRQRDFAAPRTTLETRLFEVRICELWSFLISFRCQFVIWLAKSTHAEENYCGFNYDHQ